MLAFAGLPVGHRKNDCSENCPALRLLISLLMELVKQWSLTHGGPSQKKKKKKEKVLEEYREKMQREKRNENKNEVNLCVGGKNIIRFHQMWRCAATLRKDGNQRDRREGDTQTEGRAKERESKYQCCY